MSKGIKKKSVAMDMTAMCDMAFLLLTFFILTAQMKPKEPMKVDVPGAGSADTTAAKNTIRISVDKAGLVYLSLGDKEIREAVINGVDDFHRMGLTADQKKAFVGVNTFGFSTQTAKEALDNLGDESYIQSGIPTDTTGGELKTWLVAALQEYEFDKTLLKNGQNKPFVLIHADKEVPYKQIKKVLEVVQGDAIKINSFKLITNLE
jgi:biopolymer transport protein ExbD